MKYTKSEKFMLPSYYDKIMGPNPIKLAEELLIDCKIAPKSTVMDLGSGQGLTSIFIANNYDYKVYATDYWSEADNNQEFFDEQKVSRDKVIPVKADALNLPFDKEMFDGVISIDSYNFFGRDEKFLDDKMLPFVKKGGYIYLAISGVKKDFKGDLPKEILLSWTAEQMDYMKTLDYWKSIFQKSQGAELVDIYEMQGNEELWSDWIACDNEYAKGDKKAIDAGACKYLNFIGVILRKK